MACPKSMQIATHHPTLIYNTESAEQGQLDDTLYELFAVFTDTSSVAGYCFHVLTKQQILVLTRDG